MCCTQTHEKKHKRYMGLHHLETTDAVGITFCKQHSFLNLLVLMTVNFSKLAIFPFFSLQLFHCYYISGYFTLLVFKENVRNVKCYIQWSQREKSVKWSQDKVHVWSNKLNSSSLLFKIGTRDCCYSQAPNSSANYPII